MLVSKKLDNFTEWTLREILLRFSSFLELGEEIIIYPNSTAIYFSQKLPS